jgi:hypothetical protein
MEHYAAMSMFFVVDFLIAFALGYAVREMISRRRRYNASLRGDQRVTDRRVANRGVADNLSQDELKLLRAKMTTANGRPSELPEPAESPELLDLPESPKHTE